MNPKEIAISRQKLLDILHAVHRITLLTPEKDVGDNIAIIGDRVFTSPSCPPVDEKETRTR